jgi:hypothetical protein
VGTEMFSGNGGMKLDQGSPMTQGSPAMTGMVGLAAGVGGQAVYWICSLLNIPPPPASVAIGIGAAFLAFCHATYKLLSAYINRRAVDKHPHKEHH